MAKKKRKQKDKFDEKLFNSYEEFAEDTFNKMDKNWGLPNVTDIENDLIYLLARGQLTEILIEDDEAPKNEKKDRKTINEMYQLLFKLNMLVPIDEDEETIPELNAGTTKETVENTKPVWLKDTDKMLLDFKNFFDTKEQEELKQYRDTGGILSVKTKFIEQGRVECMWVCIRDIDLVNKIMRGRLGNTPIFMKSIKSGDWVTVKFEDIIAFQKGTND